jgi:membrane-associated PAP2 superfamily phosphatase
MKALDLLLTRRISYGAKGLYIVALFIITGVAGTWLIQKFNLDMALSSTFYKPGAILNHWPVGADFPWSWLYEFGAIPGAILMIGAFLYLVLNFFRGWDSRLTPPCLVLFFTCLIGPGIIVNGLLKPYWGRPRPSEIIEFSGDWSYRKPWEPGVAGKGKSFTCGHCSFAFATVSSIAFFPFYPMAATTGAILGAGYGTLMSVARIAQGGHFLTDAIWSAIIVFSIIALLYFNIFRVPKWAGFYKYSNPPPQPLSFRFKTGLFTLTFIVPCLLWLFFHPYYTERGRGFAFPSGVNQAVLRKGPGVDHVYRRYSSDIIHPSINYQAHGLGFPWAHIQESQKLVKDGDTIYIEVFADIEGMNTDPHVRVTLTLPIP